MENIEKVIEPIQELPAAEEEKVTSLQSSRRLPILLRLTRRTIIFLFLTLVATILFFITGNKQSFLPSNLKMLLKIIASNAIVLSIMSFSALAECLFYLIRTKKIKFAVHFFCYALTLAGSIFVMLFSLSVNLLSEGISF